jgi:adenylate cyclase
MPADQPGRDAMRVGPRALLCATTFRTGSVFDDAGFEEIRALAEAVGDKVSLAIAMSGRAFTLTFGGRYRESSRAAAELVALVDSIGDPNLELALLHAATTPNFATGELSVGLRVAERLIELANGDYLKGGSVIESPLAFAMMIRATARMCLAADGWKADLAQAVNLIREFLPIGQADMFYFRYAFAVQAGAVRLDAAALRETAEILKVADQRSDDLSVWSARFLHGFVLAQQPEPDRGRGLSLLADTREAIVQQRALAVLQPFIDVEFAKEKARQDDIDGAVVDLRSIRDREIASGGFGAYGLVTEVLVELLLHRGEPADVAAAREAIGHLAAVPTEPGIVVYEVALLRLRALLARARGEEAEYRQFVERYRAMANEIGFDGHIAMAEAMTSET